MIIHQNPKGSPSQQVLILSKTWQFFQKLWQVHSLRDVIFYVCESLAEAIEGIEREPDVFLSYDTVNNVKQVLAVMQEKKFTTKPCNAMCLYHKPIERKLLLQAGARDFLSVEEARLDIEKEDSLLIQSLEKTLGMVMQQRYFREVAESLSDIVVENTDLGFPVALQGSDFFKHLRLGIKALSQEMQLRESQLTEELPSFSEDQSLTKRQTEVCQLIVFEGLSNKEVADRLEQSLGRPVSVRTVERHRAEINKKLGRNKLAWIRYLKEAQTI